MSWLRGLVLSPTSAELWVVYQIPPGFRVVVYSIKEKNLNI
jgi:hypothetical protein